MDNNLEAILEQVARRNPGALSVCFALLDYLQELAVFDFEELLKQGITGGEIWTLYSDCCESSVATFHGCLMKYEAKAKLQANPRSEFYESR